MNGAGKAMLIMMPWLPLEIVEENIVSISYDDIITTVNPKTSFVEYYFDTIQKYEELIESEEQEALNFEDDFDGEDEEIGDETIEEIVNALQNMKKGTIH